MPFQPRAVIFDYGNVLSGPQNRADVESMAAVLKAPVARFEELYWKDRAAFDQASLTPESYWATIAGALSRTLSDEERARLIELDNHSWSFPDPVMPSWATALRAAGVRTAVLSNMPITLRTHLREFCEWLPEFDHSCYSCDVRQTKPSPEIYRSCLEGLGVTPGEALFLDDREENIDAARRLGMHALHFSNPEEAQWLIQQHYLLPVPIPCQSNGAGRA